MTRRMGFEYSSPDAYPSPSVHPSVHNAQSLHSRSSPSLYSPHQPRRIPSLSLRTLPPPPALPLSSSRGTLFATPRLPLPLPSRGLLRPTSDAPLRALRRPIAVDSYPSEALYWRKTSPTRLPSAHLLAYRPSIVRSSPRSPSPPPFRIGPKTYDPLRPEGLYQASKGAQRDLKWRQKQRQSEPLKAQPHLQRQSHAPPIPIDRARSAQYPIADLFLMPAKKSHKARRAQAEPVALATEEQKSLEATVQNSVYCHARPTKCHWTGCEALCTSWALLEKHIACCHLHRDMDAAVDADGLVVCLWAKNGKEKCGKTFASKQDCLAHCIAKDGHMGEYDSRCPYNCTTNKKTFAELMVHVTKHHKAATTPKPPVLMPVKPTLATDLPPLESLVPPEISREPVSALPGLELYGQLVKPSRVSPHSKDMVAAKDRKELPIDALHSIPNQRAGGAAITALVANARNRRIAIEELRERDPESPLIPRPAVFVAHDLHRVVADMIADDSDDEGDSDANLEQLLEYLNKDPVSDALVRPDDVTPEMHARLDGRPAVEGTAGSSAKRPSSSRADKSLEPPYSKIDIKKLHKEVKVAAWHERLSDGLKTGPRELKRARSGHGSTRRLSENGGTDSDPSLWESSAASSASSARSRAPPLRISTRMEGILVGPTSVALEDLDVAPLTSFSMSATPSSTSIGTSASSVLLSTPTEGGSRSSRSASFELGQVFATSDERVGAELGAGKAAGAKHTGRKRRAEASVEACDKKTKSRK